MSLKVWLPLTKDTKNQGLLNLPTPWDVRTRDTGGKLGQYCYSDNAIYHIENEWLGNEWSLACWVKSSNWNPYNDIILCKNTTDSGNAQFYLSIIGGAWLNIGCNSGSETLKINYTFATNTWYHVAATYDGTTLKLYLNGSEIGTKAYTSTQKTGMNNLGIGCRSTNAAGTNATGGASKRMNDVRIYDHRLSPLEVKHISQGLVLHYPLADKYIENTTNLITTEDCLSATCYNGATRKYSYGTNTDMYKEVTTFQGKKGTKVYNRTNGTDMYPYVYINNMYTSDGTNSPAYKTLSFDYYTTISTSICPYKLGSGNGTATYIVTNNETRTGTGTNQVAIPVKPNMWNHIEVTFHGITEADAQWGYIQNQPSHTSDTSNFWFFANMQLEEKDHATDYVGIGGSRIVNIIYDTSGFCNNGTISGTLTISNDTPKYKVSTYIPTTATITHSRCLDNTNQEWSCAAWVKPKVAGNYQNLNNFNEANRLYHGTYPLLYANGGTNDYYNYGNLALPVNQWSHIVFVFKNSNGMKLIYINGENHTNTGGPNKTSTPKGIPDTVVIGGSYEGGLCDYREYATALSAEDIKSLYNNSVYIDNQGNIYGAVYEEV